MATKEAGSELPKLRYIRSLALAEFGKRFRIALQSQRKVLRGFTGQYCARQEIDFDESFGPGGRFRKNVRKLDSNHEPNAGRERVSNVVPDGFKNSKLHDRNLAVDTAALQARSFALA